MRLSSDHFSWIDLGRLDETIVRKRADLTEITMYDDFFWSTGLKAIRVGEKDSNAASFGPHYQAVFDKDDGLYTILDTGASEIYISALYFEDFIDHFFEVHNVGKADFESTNATTTANCKETSKWQSIYFLLGDQWIEMRADDYVIYDERLRLCQFKFIGIDAPFNIIGLPLYIDYYVSHFMGNGIATMSFSTNGRDIKSEPKLVDPEYTAGRVYQVKLAT